MSTTTTDSTTSRTARPRAFRSHRVAVRAVTLVCLLAALVGLSAPQASAISRYTVWQGSPGALIKNSQVVGWPSYAGSPSKITMQAAHVRRSPATAGAQTVVYEYRVYGWNGSAWNYGGGTYGLMRTIPAGQSGAILDGNGWGGSIDLPASIRGGGYMAVELAVSFYSGSQLLGRFNVWHDQAGDYVCGRQTTLAGRCVVYPGYVYLS